MEAITVKCSWRCQESPWSRQINFEIIYKWCTKSVWHLLTVGGRRVSSKRLFMWWHRCFHATRKEHRRNLPADLPQTWTRGIASVWEDVGRMSGARPPVQRWPLAPGKLFWCEMGICVLATTQILGGCFLSFAFARLWWNGVRGLPFDRLWWQAKKLGEPVPDTLSWHSLRLRSPSQEGGGSGWPHCMWGHFPKGLA